MISTSAAAAAATSVATSVGLSIRFDKTETTEQRSSPSPVQQRCENTEPRLHHQAYLRCNISESVSCTEHHCPPASANKHPVLKLKAAVLATDNRGLKASLLASLMVPAGLRAACTRSDYAEKRCNFRGSMGERVW